MTFGKARRYLTPTRQAVGFWLVLSLCTVTLVWPLGAKAEDMLGLGKGNSRIFVRISLRETDVQFQSVSYPAFPKDLQFSILGVADLTGDGRSEVIAEDIAHDSFWIGSLLAEAGATQGRIEFKPWSGPSLRGKRVLLDDLNRDGCEDIVVFPKEDSLTTPRTVSTAISNCRDAFSPTGYASPLPSGKSAQVYLRNEDGDGRVALALQEKREADSLIHFLPLPQGEALESKQNNPSGSSIETSQEVVLLGFGRFLSHSTEAPLLLLKIQNSTSTIFRLGVTEGVYSGDFLWAQFPWSSQETPVPIIADFSGDGLDDFLLHSPRPLLGWWLAESSRGLAIESPLKGIDSSTPLNAGAYAGDFDGDGLADLLQPLASGSGVLVSFARVGLPLANAEISLDSVPLGKSDSMGAFEIPMATPGRHELTASFEDISGEKKRASRIIETRADRAHRVYLQIPRPNAGDQFVGQALSRGSDRPGPYICLGYTPRQAFQKWGLVSGECPEGYAFLSAERQKISANEYGPILGSCCRLPASDILTAERVEVEATCPDGFVANGARNSALPNRLEKPRLVCARVNTKRYRLGSKTSGVFWGISLALQNRAPMFLREQIPLAIRYGLERFDYGTWENRGCLGKPWGSLVVTLGGEDCVESSYRELQYTGAYSGDPESGTPVKMYPDCSEIENIFDPTSGCRPQK